MQANLEQQARLEALYHLAVELSAQRSLQSVLQTALDHCLNLTDSQFGFVGLTTPDGKAMDVVQTRGFHPAQEFYAHNHMIPLRPNIFAHVVLQDRPIRSVDARQDPRRVGQPSGHPPVASFLGVPLRLRDQPIGMIGVANRPNPYEDDHEQLLMTYAAQIAIVIRNTQLVEQLTAANAELERKVTHRTQALADAQSILRQKADQLQKLLSETVDVQERVVAELLTPQAESQSPQQRLNAKEVEILSLLAEGASNANIATKLFVSETTIKRNIRAICDKMQVQSRTQAVAEAVRHGFI